MREHFRIAVRRHVAKDRTVSLHGKLFEALTGVIGQTVTLLYHRADPQRIEVICDERSWGFLVTLDVNSVACAARSDMKPAESYTAD